MGGVMRGRGGGEAAGSGGPGAQGGGCSALHCTALHCTALHCTALVLGSARCSVQCKEKYSVFSDVHLAENTISHDIVEFSGHSAIKLMLDLPSTAVWNMFIFGPSVYSSCF